jgi:cell division protein FtsI/penicillin-binding protein 2
MGHAKVILLIAFVALAAKLFDIQVRQHSALADRLAKQQTQHILLHAHRGAILDRNGDVIAAEQPTYDVEAHIPEMQDAEAVARAVAHVAGGDTEQLRARILAFAQRSPERSLVLVRDLPWNEEARRALTGVRGIVVTEQRDRTYSLGYRGGQMTGCVSADGEGQQGIEKDWDTELAGRDGQAEVRLTPGPSVPDPASSRHIRIRLPVLGQDYRILRQPQDGKSIYLTIDARIQTIVEEELARGLTESGAKGGTVVVLHPKTGDILALASVPSFNANDRAARRRATAPDRRNLAVGLRYEPGSVAKPLVVAAGLDAGVVSLSSTFKCTGSLRYAGSTMRCWVGGRGHGTETLSEVIRDSCNVGAALTAKALGAPRATSYLRSFGLAQPTLERCSAEAAGFIPSPDRLVPSDVLRLGFGQAFSVTPIGLARAFTVFANDGIMVQPRLLHKITDPKDGSAQVLPQPQAKRVISASAARAVREMMVSVVDGGTGKSAAIPGLRIAGKTGTAQKATAGKGFNSDAVVTSFIGLFPAQSPTYLVLVVYDEPQRLKWGSVAAAPVFRRIALRLAQRDGLLSSTPPSAEHQRRAAQ